MVGVTAERVLRALTETAETSAVRYRWLFEAIDEGFCIIEVLWDADGRPVDYRFLEVNPAFAHHTGLADPVGRTARELIDDLDEHWFEVYGRVARTREPARLEDDAVAMGRVFDVYAFPVEDPRRSQVAVLFSDISGRRRRERHLAFLAELAEETESIQDPAELMRVAGARLGALLGAGRCDLVETDPGADEARVVPLWAAEGAPPAPGRLRMSELAGDWSGRAADVGEPVVVRDVGTDPRTHRRTAGYEATGARAWIAVPMVPGGAPAGRRILVLVDAAARDWHGDEVDLVAELAVRLGARVERAEAQEALRDRDLRLRLALEASGAGTFVWHPQEDRAEPDARLRELAGLEDGQEMSLAASLGSLVHPDSRAATQAAIARALDPAGDGLYLDEVHLVTPAGEDRWLSVAGRATFEGHPPRATRLFGMATDVTARRRAEEALRASAARQEFLVRLNDALRPLARPAAIRRTAARALEDHLRADRVVLVDGLSSAPVGGPAGLAGAAALLRAGGPTVIDDVAASPLLGPRERALAASMEAGAVIAAPIAGPGGPAAALLVVSAAPRRWRPDEAELAQDVADATWAAMERARAASAVRESERRLQRALAIETVGVIFFDRQGTLTDANDAFLRASGYGRDALERGDLTWERIAPAEGIAATRAAMAELRRRGRTAPREVEYVRRDGTRWPALAAATMLSRDEGVEFVVDLTDVRAARDAARAERAVRERREREFVANAAHEMRTPLTGVIGAVQALQAGAAAIPAERDRFLSHLGREAARLSRLNESLLLLAAIDGAGALPRARVPLLEVLEDVASDLVVAPGVEVVVGADPELVVVTNQGLVERVVANVAENAAKHTAVGRIDLTARRDGDAVVVEVRDTGTGLGDATAERAFDRFYRGGDRSGDGFGLGLAIARQAAVAVGGTLDLSDAAGGGALARLTLPAPPGPGAA
jgi:PAS domain S-box-containing protein